MTKDNPCWYCGASEGEPCLAQNQRPRRPMKGYHPERRKSARYGNGEVYRRI